ncbi:MAG: hypothetical protein EYC68_21905 [Chloroflexota bacterium]|nr:MAG: hypothetical protein EYC68_21905 [Chloroflexota bacterium]
MNPQNRPRENTTFDNTPLYRAAGICAILFSVAYIAIIGLYVPVGRPNGTEQWLTNLGANAAVWSAIIWLSVLTDFLLIPIALALYLALNPLHRNAMRVATAFYGLFVFLDLALTWTNIGSLHTLATHYAEANEIRRVALVTAAMYPSSIVESNLVFVYNSLTLAIAILLTGFVMLNGTMGKSTAYVGLATGILGIFAVAASFFASAVSSIAIIFTSILTLVWFLMVGIRLIRPIQE